MCEQIKSYEEFYKRNNRKLGVHSRCKVCIKANFKKYIANRSPSKPKTQSQYKDSNLRRYGLNLEKFNAMLEKQGGSCKVCYGPSMGKGTYHVDHDHKTGKVRGLLCHKCNVALGMVQDSKSHLLALINYLELT